MDGVNLNSSKNSTLNLNRDELDLMFQRASYLMSQGSIKSASAMFIEILKVDPTHLGTLINFAVLLVDTGYNSAAKSAYIQAITHHPSNLLAHINLANLYFIERQFEEAKLHYQRVLGIAKSLSVEERAELRTIEQVARAHQGLALTYFEDGDLELANTHHSTGYSLEPIRSYAHTDQIPAKSLLVLVGGRGGDIPWVTIVDQSVFFVQTLAVEFWRSSIEKLQPVGKYDLLLNAIGDADSSESSLRCAKDFLDFYLGQGSSPFESAIVINEPNAVLLTGRKTNADRFKRLPDVKTPSTLILKRAAFQSVSSLEKSLDGQIDFPVLVRSLGFQTGKHFELAQTPYELITLARDLPGEELLVMEFLNALDADGYFRKYRVMFIDGKMYPLHLALSKSWKVHYFSAAMKDSPLNRAKEQFFLEHMPEALGASAIHALEGVQKELALDYAGIDFGLSQEGKVLIFEANPTMIMALPPNDAIWDYRRGLIQAAKLAAQQMLIRSARQ